MNINPSLNSINNNNLNSDALSAPFTFCSTNQHLILTGNITPIEMQKIQDIASLVKSIYIKTDKPIEEINFNGIKFNNVASVNISQCKNINLSILPELFPRATHYTMDATVYSTAPRSSFLSWETVTSLRLKALGALTHLDPMKIPNLILLNEIPKETFLNNIVAVKRSKQEVDDDSDTLYTYGVFYLKINVEKAIKFFKKAAALGNANAMFKLAVLHEEGIDVEKNLAKAIELYQQAIDLDHPKAMLNLALLYEEGIDVEKNLEKAIELYQKATDLGHPESMFNLALLYEEGIGVEKNLAKAIELYQKAADLNYSNAMINLGVLYETQASMEDQNNPEKAKSLYQQAIDLYEQALELGNMGAAYNLALRYEKDNDKEKAFTFFQIAADSGDPDALYWLALHPLNGLNSESSSESDLDNLLND